MQTKSKSAESVKAKAPDGVAGDPSSQLSKYIIETKADHYNLEKPVERYTLSSGSLNLDSEGVVFPPGAFRACGGPNLGKTPFLLNIADTLLDVVPHSRVIWCMSEGRLSPQNMARVRHKIVTDASEWVDGTIFAFKTNIFETWINLMRKLVTDNPTGCRYGFFTDSIDNMTLRDDLAKEVSEAGKIAGGPALTKKLFQKIGIAMRERGHWSFFVSQKTAAPKIDPYAKTEIRQTEGSGGNSLAHNADEVIEFQEWYESDQILDKPDEKPDKLKNPVRGHNVRVKIRKSSNEKRYVTVLVPIKHGVTQGNAIWREREISDQLLAWGLVSKAGSWITLTDVLTKELNDHDIKDIPEKVQGLNQLNDLLEKRQDITQYLFAKFKTMIGGAK